MQVVLLKKSERVIKIEYQIFRSSRKTTVLTVNKKLEIIVKTSFAMPKSKIDDFVISHENWIQKQKNKLTTFSITIKVEEDEIKTLKIKAKEYLKERVSYFENIMNVHCSGIKINSAKARWGSCTYKNSINFSYRLMLLPSDLIDFVVVHELSHIIHKNHSKAFYNYLSNYIVDYKLKRKELAKYIIE